MRERGGREKDERERGEGEKIERNTRGGGEQTGKDLGKWLIFW